MNRLRWFCSLGNAATMTTANIKSPPTRPLVVILGSTGTGKSDLAVEIATRFHGEVINADAMQMYQGLPIITNQIPVHEQRGVPHHLLGHIPIDAETWVVHYFRRKAMAVIDEIRSRGKLPIVVGGTYYYTQALLFEDRLVTKGEADDTADTPSRDAEFPILDGPTEVMLAKLREVDPVMAERWHPNDWRKIRRSLEIYLKTGRRASDIYAEQEMRRNSPAVDSKEASGGAWENLLLWVHSEREVLKARLDARVDKMIEAGLMDEVQELYGYLKDQRAAGKEVDLTRGIWQSIGFKEFQQYLEAADEPAPSSEDAAAEREKQLEKLRTAAVEDIKQTTRQYSKYQTRWIARKLIPVLKEEHPEAMNHLFVLNSTDVAKWSENVASPGAEVTRAFLAGEALPSPATLSEEAARVLKEAGGAAFYVPCRKVCDTCNVTSLYEHMWEEHMKSHRHRRATTRRKRMALVPVPEPDSTALEAARDKTLDRASSPDLDMSLIHPP